MRSRQAPHRNMSTSQLSPQSAAARRSAEAQVRGLVARFAPAQQRLVGTMRRSLRKRLPTAHEVVYEYRDWFVISYSPNGLGYDGVLAIRGSANGIALYFNRGKELPDPGKVLRGSGTQVRFIQMERTSTLTHPAVARLIEEAIGRTRVPFARTGPGPVVVRAAAARPRGRRRPA